MKIEWVLNNPLRDYDGFRCRPETETVGVSLSCEEMYRKVERARPCLVIGELSLGRLLHGGVRV